MRSGLLTRLASPHSGPKLWWLWLQISVSMLEGWRASKRSPFPHLHKHGNHPTTITLVSKRLNAVTIMSLNAKLQLGWLCMVWSHQSRREVSHIWRPCRLKVPQFIDEPCRPAAAVLVARVWHGATGEGQTHPSGTVWKNNGSNKNKAGRSSCRLLMCLNVSSGFETQSKVYAQPWRPRGHISVHAKVSTSVNKSNTHSARTRWHTAALLPASSALTPSPLSGYLLCSMWVYSYAPKRDTIGRSLFFQW